MNAENRNCMYEIFDEVRDGLGPYVLKRYKMFYSAKSYLQCLQENLGDKLPQYENEEEALQGTDVYGWIKAVEKAWHDVFSKNIGPQAPKAKTNIDVANSRNYLYEIKYARNQLAHQTKSFVFTDYDVHRLADTAFRLLTVIPKSKKQTIEDIRNSYGVRLYYQEPVATENEVTSAEAPQPDDTLASPSPEDQLSNWKKEPPVKTVQQNSKVLIDLRKANLRGMDLRNRNLRFANLSGAVMVESNLRDEDLKEAQFDHAELRRADMSEAKLSDTFFRHADLSDATLSHAVLLRTKLHRAKLKNANMQFTYLQHADLSEADLDSANLKNARLQFANLTEANLVGADFRGANLLGAVLKGAKTNWSGHIFGLGGAEAIFDKTTILPDGSRWKYGTDMTKFTGTPKDG